MKLTPWFVNGEKPVRPGVYNVSCEKSAQSGRWYSYWDGRKFGPFFARVEWAREATIELGSKKWHAGVGLLRRGSWRGLAEEPKP